MLTLREKIMNNLTFSKLQEHLTNYVRQSNAWMSSNTDCGIRFSLLRDLLANRLHLSSSVSPFIFMIQINPHVAAGERGEVIALVTMKDENASSMVDATPALPFPIRKIDLHNESTFLNLSKTLQARNVLIAVQHFVNFSNQ